MDLPARSEIVIIGGGVVGCSIAYQLARRGKTDVTVLERRRLTEGSTWHAAGLVGQLRASGSLTRLMRQSTATYESLERETGYPAGWRRAGSIRVAASDDRWTELRRLAATARAAGLRGQPDLGGRGARAVPAAAHRRHPRRDLGAVGRLRGPQPAHPVIRGRRPGGRGTDHPGLPGNDHDY